MDLCDELEQVRSILARSQAAVARAMATAEGASDRLARIRAETERRVVRAQGAWTAAERRLRRAEEPGIHASTRRPAGPDAP